MVPESNETGTVGKRTAGHRQRNTAGDPGGLGARGGGAAAVHEPGIWQRV